MKEYEQEIEYEPDYRRRRPPARGRKRKKRPNIILPVLVILVGGIFIIWWQFFRDTEYAMPVIAAQREEVPTNSLADVLTRESADVPVNESVDETIAAQPEEPIEEQGLSLVSTPRTQLRDTGYLKLVNRNLAKSRPTDPGYMVQAWPTVPVRASYITVHQTLLNALYSLFTDGEQIADFFVTSGYRGVDRQREIYQNSTNRLYVMPPGHSEHHLGLAADILAPGIPLSSAAMSGTPEAIWLAENAWRHGMILRYPYGTTHITEVAYEPWHFRYVGRIHAWYMTDNGMVLEEYLAYLEAQGGFTTVLDGVTYHVMYQRPVNYHLYVPSNLEFNVSASNRGGYVITAWE